MFAVIWLRDLWVTSQDVEPLAYSEFLQMLDEGRIAEITITDTAIQGKLKQPLAQGETRDPSPPRPSPRAKALERGALSSAGSTGPGRAPARPGDRALLAAPRTREALPHEPLG